MAKVNKSFIEEEEITSNQWICILSKTLILDQQF